MKRFTVPVDEQGEFESEHLWQHVSAAIARDDQVSTVFDPVVSTCMFGMENKLSVWHVGFWHNF
jgi:hypothetical protein